MRPLTVAEQLFKPCQPGLEDCVGGPVCRCEKEQQRQNDLQSRIKELETQVRRWRWQPISTAPKDTDVWVCKYINDEWCYCKSRLVFESGTLENVADYWYWVCDHDADGVTGDEGPEYWMPLFSPP